MLCGDQLQVGLPRREVVGFVLPGFAKRDAFEFAEGLFHVRAMAWRLWLEFLAWVVHCVAGFGPFSLGNTIKP